MTKNNALVCKLYEWLLWIDNHLLRHRVGFICRRVHIDWCSELTPEELEYAIQLEAEYMAGNNDGTA